MTASEARRDAAVPSVGLDQAAGGAAGTGARPASRGRAVRDAAPCVANGPEVDLLGFKGPGRGGEVFLARRRPGRAAPARRAAPCGRAIERGQPDPVSSCGSASSDSDREARRELLEKAMLQAPSGGAGRSASCRTPGRGRSPALQEVAREQSASARSCSDRASPALPSAAGRPRWHRRSSRRAPGRPCRPTSRPRRAAFVQNPLSLLRHQRSSPRGSFGTSHSRSQRWPRERSGASARRPQRPHLARCGKVQRWAVPDNCQRPEHAQENAGIRGSMSDEADSTCVSTLPPTPAPPSPFYHRNRKVASRGDCASAHDPPKAVDGPRDLREKSDVTSCPATMNHGRARPPLRQHPRHRRRHAGHPGQQSRSRPRHDLRQGGVLQSRGFGQGPAGAQHHRGGRAQRLAQARPDRGRGDQRQHRHRARHGLRPEGLPPGRDHGRQLLDRAPQADAHAGGEGGADAPRPEGLRHVQQGRRAGRGQRLVPRPPVRDRGQRRHPRGHDRAGDHQRFRRLEARLLRHRLRHGRHRRRGRSRAAEGAARDQDHPERARERATRRQRPRPGAHPRSRPRHEPPGLRAAPDPGLDPGLHPLRPSGGDRPPASTTS